MFSNCVVASRWLHAWRAGVIVVGGITSSCSDEPAGVVGRVSSGTTGIDAADGHAPCTLTFATSRNMQLPARFVEKRAAVDGMQGLAIPGYYSLERRLANNEVEFKRVPVPWGEEVGSGRVLAEGPVIEEEQYWAHPSDVDVSDAQESHVGRREAASPVSLAIDIDRSGRVCFGFIGVPAELVGLAAGETRRDAGGGIVERTRFAVACSTEDAVEFVGKKAPAPMPGGLVIRFDEASGLVANRMTVTVAGPGPSYLIVETCEDGAIRILPGGAGPSGDTAQR